MAGARSVLAVNVERLEGGRGKADMTRTNSFLSRQ
jgi:hypothetical protein